MDALARAGATGVALVLLVGLGACGGSKATTVGAPVATAPTSVAHVPSLADVFNTPLPAGFSLVDAPAAQLSTLRQQLQTADAAKVFRDADLKVIQRAGKVIGSVVVFLLRRGQEQQEAGMVKGFAESRSGSSRTSAVIGGKNVTLIKWPGSADLAYAASASQIVVITDVNGKTDLDAVTPSLIASIQ